MGDSTAQGGRLRARRATEDTRAIRSAADLAQRRELAERMAEGLRLQLALASRVCRHCGQSVWIVSHTEGRTRYVKCRGCGHNDKISI